MAQTTNHVHQPAIRVQFEDKLFYVLFSAISLLVIALLLGLTYSISSTASLVLVASVALLSVGILCTWKRNQIGNHRHFRQMGNRVRWIRLSDGEINLAPTINQTHRISIITPDSPPGYNDLSPPSYEESQKTIQHI